MKKQENNLRKKIATLKLLPLVALFAIASCKKDSEIFVPDGPNPASPDTAWIQVIQPTSPVSIMRNALKPASSFRTFTMPTSLNITVPLDSGISLIIESGSLLIPGAANSLATGQITVEYKLPRARGELIRNLSYSQFEGNVYDVARQFYISFKNSNQQVLTVASNKSFKLKFSVTNSISRHLDLFYGSEDSTGYIKWFENFNPGNSIQTEFNSPNYFITSQKTGWIQAAEVENEHQSNKLITVNLPSNYYTNANTQVFFVFNSSVSSLAAEGLYTERKFKFNLKEFDTLQQGRIVVITRMGSDYYYAVQPEVFSQGAYPQTINLTSQVTKTSFQQLLQNLDSLH